MTLACKAGTSRLQNLTNVDGKAQPAASQISEMDTPLDHAQEEAMPLVEWAHRSPMGYGKLKEEYVRVISPTNHLEIPCFVTGPPLARLPKPTKSCSDFLYGSGTRAFSRCELACRLLESSAPLFFPHRSLGGRKREGTSGGVTLWKESYPWAQRGKTETLAIRAVSPAERSVSLGFSLSMTHTQRECHQRAGETCTSYNDGAAFATTPWNLLFFREALWIVPDGCRGWPSLQAGRCERT